MTGLKDALRRSLLVFLRMLSPETPDGHARTRTQTGEGAPDAAIADDPHPLPRQLRSQRMALEPAMPLVGHRELGDPPAEHDHRGEGVLGNGGRVRPCSIRDQDPPLEQVVREEILYACGHAVDPAQARHCPGEVVRGGGLGADSRDQDLGLVQRRLSGRRILDDVHVQQTEDVFRVRCQVEIVVEWSRDDRADLSGLHCVCLRVSPSRLTRSTAFTIPS